MALSAFSVQYELRRHRRDNFFQFIKALLQTPFVLHTGKRLGDARTGRDSQQLSVCAELAEGYESVLSGIEQMVEEHRIDPKGSRLRQLVPSVGSFWTPLPLAAAFRRYDERVRISGRMFVQPSFNDVRHICNLSQTMALAGHLRLVTLDGDETLYADGKDFQNDELAALIVALLEAGVCVAVVTAAGYENKPGRYEQRLCGLLRTFRARALPPSTTEKFWVMGGECNFLFQCGADYALHPLDPGDFRLPIVKAWEEEKIQALLDAAESSLKAAIKRLALPMSLYRKSRAVGTIRTPGAAVTRQSLDELVLSCRDDISRANVGIPYCAFNGGSDVWVDIGDKHIGVQTLQAHLGVSGADTVHIGDQFLSTGNDLSTRRACTTVWVASPEETVGLLSDMVADLATTVHPDTALATTAATTSVAATEAEAKS
eukprot:UC1_evm1s517